MSCRLHFDREDDIEAGTTEGILQGGKALGQATGAGEQVDDGYRSVMADRLQGRHVCEAACRTITGEARTTWGELRERGATLRLVHEAAIRQSVRCFRDRLEFAPSYACRTITRSSLIASTTFCEMQAWSRSFLAKQASS